MRRVLLRNAGWAVASILLGLIVVAGITSVAAAQGNTLTVWRGKLGDAWDTLENEIIADFQKQYPGVKVEETVMPWDKLREKVFTVLQMGGEAPDLLWEGLNFVGAYAKLGGLQELDDFLKGWPEREAMPARVWDAARYKGKIYGLPFGGIPFVTLYNKQQFAEAGVQPPTTWEQWLDVSKKLTDAKRERYAWAVRTDRLLPDYFLELLWQAGGEIFAGRTRGPADGAAPALNSPAGVAAAQELVRRGEFAPGGVKGNVGLAGPDVVALFAKGRIAMLSGSIHQYGQTLSLNPQMKDTIGAFVTPSPSGKPPKGFLIGQVLFMTKKSAAKPAAWNFMRSYMDKRWEVKRSTMLGYAPFRTDITDPQVTTHPIIKVGIQTIQTGVFQPDFPEWLEYRDQLKTELQKILLGQKGAQPALDDANRALAGVLK